MAVRDIAKQLLGTAVAVLSGWLAALLLFEIITLINVLRKPHEVVPDALWVTPLTVSMVMSWFVIPVWLLVLIPLYIFVPSSSVLWRAPICSVCGVIAGVLILSFWVGGIPGTGGLPQKAGGCISLLLLSEELHA
jgi:hypothetical protein